MNVDQPAGDPEWGYLVKFAPSATDILHDFCGENFIAAAFCPNCQRPFTRLMSLNTADKALNIERYTLPTVHLLYCWTCSIPFGTFSYKMNNDGSVELLTLPPRKPDSEHGPNGPYDGYTGLFPHRLVALESLSPEEQLKQRNYWLSPDSDPVDFEVDELRHQIGGYPFIYNPLKTSCQICLGDMPLFASICNDAGGNFAFGAPEGGSFVGNGGVQMVFHFCRKCSVVSAYSSCD